MLSLALIHSDIGITYRKRNARMMTGQPMLKTKSSELVWNMKGK